MVCFFKCLETSPFRRRLFCKCAINRLAHAFPSWETYLQMARWFQRSIWLAASPMRCSLQETFFFALCLSCMHRALLRANQQISIFRACTTHPEVALVSSGTKASATLRKNRKSSVCLLLFHEWQIPELLRGYPYFRNTLLILMIFQNMVQP